MTRQEALERIPLPRWYGEEAQRGWLLDSLVALGLLKFDGGSELSPALDAAIDDEINNPPKSIME